MKEYQEARLHADIYTSGGVITRYTKRFIKMIYIYLLNNFKYRIIEIEELIN